MSWSSWLSKCSAISTAPSSQAAWKATRILSDKRRCPRALGHMPERGGEGCRVGSLRRLSAMAGNLANDAKTEKSEHRYQSGMVTGRGAISSGVAGRRWGTSGMAGG
jgi:hypothetical protein